MTLDAVALNAIILRHLRLGYSPDSVPPFLYKAAEAAGKEIAGMLTVQGEVAEWSKRSKLPVQVIQAFYDTNLPIIDMGGSSHNEFVHEVNVRYGEHEPLVYLVKSIDGRWIISDSEGAIPLTKVFELSTALSKIMTKD